MFFKRDDINPSALKISLHLKEDEDNLLPKKVQHIYLAVCNKQTVSSSFASVNTGPGGF